MWEDRTSKIMDRELKVYIVNDMDWIDNLKIAYKEETGEEIDKKIIRE